MSNQPQHSVTLSTAERLRALAIPLAIALPIIVLFIVYALPWAKQAGAEPCALSFGYPNGLILLYCAVGVVSLSIAGLMLQNAYRALQVLQSQQYPAPQMRTNKAVKVRHGNSARLIGTAQLCGSLLIIALVTVPIKPALTDLSQQMLQRCSQPSQSAAL